MTVKKTWLVTLALVLITLPTAHAADKKNNNAQKEAMRHMQQMKQEFEQQKSQLEQDKAGLEAKMKTSEQEKEATKKELEAAGEEKKSLGGQLARSKQEKSALDTRLKKLETDKKSVEAALQAEQDKNKALTTQLQENQKLLADNEKQRQEMSTRLVRKSDEVTDCEAKNKRLEALGQSLIKRFDTPDYHTKAVGGEPFTKTKQINAEVLLQDARDDMDLQKFQASPK